MQIKSNTQPLMVFAFVALYGLGYGSVPPLKPAITADIFQGRGFGAIYGSTYIGQGIAGFFGPWLAGYLFDTMGHYMVAFSLAAIAYCCSSAAFWIAGPRHIRLVPGRVPKALR
jgi:MFS family permease